MQNMKTIEPFPRCPALDGYHCQTSSLAKMFHFYGHPLSEEMLLGLGAGMGFIYWQTKMGATESVFVGGRGNNKDFFHDIGRRTGIRIEAKTTSSEKKAEGILLEQLTRQKPVMVFGDMGFLPWFDFPKDYHFGGHAFVVCGFDGQETVLASDIDPKTSGLKKGFYHPVSLEQLKKARNSSYKPFPPKNMYFEFDFKDYHDPTPRDLFAAIRQTVESQLNPPIKNIGVKGIRHTAKELQKWPTIFGYKELRLNLFNLYIFIEIGGTGGGCFRTMYSRFLKKAAKLTEKPELTSAAEKMNESGQLFSEIGLLFQNPEQGVNLTEKIASASEKFNRIADIEEDVFHALKNIIE